MKKPIKVVALTLLLASSMLIGKKVFATGGGSQEAPGCYYTGLAIDQCSFTYQGNNYSAINCKPGDGDACYFNPPQ